jgi:type 2 lantibiotic biosynthesis protein LanM
MTNMTDENKNSSQSLNNNFDTFKYNKYMSVCPFNDKGSFKRWLDINKLTHDAFLTWFDKDKQERSRTENCPWMAFFLNDYCARKYVKDQYNNHFGVFIDFFIVRAKKQLKEKLANIPNRHLSSVNPDVFVKLLAKELIRSLTIMITPTLTLELNVARVSNTLTGSTSEQRFNHFLELLLEKDYVFQVFQEYGVLHEMLVNKTENYISEYVEFYHRLVKDYAELNSIFGPLGAFVDHSSEKGDSHNNGRFVRVCRFKNNRIVYKPRNLKADVQFQLLLSALNINAGTTFKTCTYVEKETYGWSEFVEYQACKDANEYKSYYTSLGQYLALLYVLNSSDIHFENVIACGKHPIIVDLETIIHCDKGSGNSTHLHAIHTVLDSMVLPQKSFYINQKKGFDVSVIGYYMQKGRSLRINPNNISDDVSFKQTQVDFSGSGSVHSVENDFAVSIKSIEQLLSNGFKTLYGFLQKNRQWLGSNSHYRSMLDLNYRCILRSTNLYSSLLIDLLHPDNLRSKLDQYLYITNKLWTLKYQGKLNDTSQYESQSLAAGDVPIFSFLPKSTDIVCGNNHRLKGYFYQKAFDKLEAIGRQMSDSNLKLQLWLIGASLFSKDNGAEVLPIKLVENQNLAPTKLNDVIAENLQQLSFSTDNDYKWYNKSLGNGEKHWYLSTQLEHELFNGSLGSLLYLAYFAQNNNDRKVLDRVLWSVHCLVSHYREKSFENIGGFCGVGGVLYALSKIHAISNSITINNHVHLLDKTINDLITADRHYDIISGSAGCILALISAYGIFHKNNLLVTADKCADHLLNNFTVNEGGSGWPNAGSEGRVVGGFSHGVTGVAYALAQLQSINHQDRYQNCIDQAFDHEDSLYDSATNNYIDLRTDVKNHRSNADFSAWCNGALGIGLARIEILKDNIQTHRKKQFETEIPRFVDKIITNGFNANDSLCHGNAGALEYLFQVSRHYPKYYSPKDFEQILLTIEKRILSEGIQNGTYFNLFDPGLMLGSLGMAYQLLRFKSPNKVGNILLLN